MAGMKTPTEALRAVPPAATHLPAWLGWAQLARHAGVSADTLRRWARLPGFPPVCYPTSRRPRVRVAAFDAWLAQQAGPSAPGVDEVLAEIRAKKRA